MFFFFLLKASNSLLELQNLAAPHSNVKYRVIDIKRESTYLHLMHETDIVIRCVLSSRVLKNYTHWTNSLLPAEMHPAIARLCISFEKHLITASYVSPDMQELNQRYASILNIQLLSC